MIEGVYKLRRHAGAKETIPNIEKKINHNMYNIISSPRSSYTHPIK